VRTVCEPYFTRPLSQISLGEVVVKLFAVARQYELTLQPQLILLQKTLLNIEGIGRTLYPDIDIWAVARPVLAGILRERYGLRRALRELRSRVPTWLAAAPEMPQLVHTYLRKAAAGDFDTERARDDVAKASADRAAAQSLILAVIGATALLSATILYALDVRVAHLPRAWTALLATIVGVAAFVQAWRRSR
jgi:ubiquinone biosynthesis protein